MNRILVRLIELYQRYLSPHKGFHCAHRALHRGPSCSNAVRDLILEHGAVAAWPKIKLRFSECRAASYELRTETADLPCDVSCGLDLFDGVGPSGKSVGNSCGSAPCDLLGEFSSRSKKTQRRILVGVFLVILFITYWFYGRAVNAVYIEKTSARSSLVERLFNRDQPKLRVMLEVDGKKYYSEAVPFDSSENKIRLALRGGPTAYQIDLLEIHDARFQVGGDLLVIGQVLESYSQPKRSDQGTSFNYRQTRRWHFWE